MAKFKKIVNIISLSFLGLAAVLAILLAGVRIFGLAPYTVISGSMEPKYPVGSIVYVKDVPPTELKEKDVITYTIDGKTVVTHRIIEVLCDEKDPTVRYFRTQGDNNGTPDSDPVHQGNVLGKVVFSLPVLGFVAYFIQTPPLTYIALSICFMVLLLTFMPDLMEKMIAEEQEQKSKKE